MSPMDASGGHDSYDGGPHTMSIPSSSSRDVEVADRIGAPLPSVPASDDERDDGCDTFFRRRRRTRREDKLSRRPFESSDGECDEDAFSPPPSRRRSPLDAAVATPEAPPLEFSSTHGDDELSGGDKRATLRTMHRATTLILLAIAFTVVTHRCTFSKLRHRLHYLGTYRMRGVPAFGHGKRAPRSNGRSSPRGHGAEGRHLDERGPETTSAASAASASSSAAPVPLMAQREFANRRGERIAIPRGVPLPPPLLALAEVRMCGRATGEEECLRNASDDDRIALSCAWCPGGGAGGGCVPRTMTDVMCGGGRVG